MAGRKVGILLHHLDGFPSTKLFEHHEQCVALDMPARSGVPVSWKREILDAGISDSLAEHAVIPVLDVLAIARQHETRLASHWSSTLFRTHRPGVVLIPGFLNGI